MADHPLGSVSVLHVDDDPEFADVTATFLEREYDGFVVETATRVREGENRLADGDFDCVVSDYDMPGRDGIEFLESVRKEYPDLPFVLYTGKGSEEVASEAISAGITDYLQKGSGTDQYAVLANRIRNAVEHYRSQQALSERNRALRSYERMINSMHEAACVYNADGCFEIVNEYLAEWYGTTREDLEGQESSLITFLRSGADGDPYQALLDGERTELRGEFDAEFPGRGYAVIEYHLTPLAVDGSIEGVVGVARDITERKDREQELKRHEAYIEESTDIITVLDDSGTIQYQSPAVSRVLGYGTEELVGRNGFEFIHPDDVDEVRSTFADLVAEPGETASVECRFRTADDEWRWLEINGTNRLDYEPIDGVVTNNRDITERKRYEQRLEALNRATSELITADTQEEVADIGVEVARETLGLEASAIHLYDETDSVLEPVAVSDAVYDLVGEPPTFREGNSIAWRVYDAGETRAIGNVHADPDTYNAETEIRSELFLPLGEYGILIAGSVTAEAFDQQDVVLGEILAGNITSALEQVERAEQLRTRGRELTRQNERLEEFASVVSHDLRNPLNVAELRVELAQEECDNEHLAAAADAHDRMESLIDDLLMLAHGRETPSESTAIELAAFAENCWRNVDTKAATLVADVSRTVRADETRLQRLFENLIRNAVEHGGDDVTVTIGDVDGGFYIADDGPGIPDDDRADVFDAGYSTNSEGTGFGLSIVEQVAETHEWDIRVIEGEDGGARFEITGMEME